MPSARRGHAARAWSPGCRSPTSNRQVVSRNSSMKAFLYSSLRHLMYRAGMFFGDEFARATTQFGGGTFPSLAATLTYLCDWGYRPATIVDVGAFRGDWT